MNQPHLFPSRPPSMFTGKPFVRPAAKPSNPARVINGKLMRVNDGLDVILFGKNESYMMEQVNFAMDKIMGEK